MLRNGILKENLWKSRQLSSAVSGKPYEDIPGPPCNPILGHARLLRDHDFNWKMNVVLADYREKYGDIIKLKFPFMEDLLFAFDPDDVKTVFSVDGKTPNIPYGDFNHKQRKDMLSEFYPGNKGLTGSQGSEWYYIRSRVQQDMMRAKSAYFYINTMESIAVELVDAIDRRRDHNQEVADLSPLMDDWSFESIASIFMARRYNMLHENQDPNSDGRVIFDYISKYLHNTNFIQLFILCQFIQTRFYSVLPFMVKQAQKEGLQGKFFKLILPDALNSPVFNIFFDNFHESLERIKLQDQYQTAHDNVAEAFGETTISDTDNKEKSIIERLAEKHGYDSEVLPILCTEAVLGGYDTTAATLSFLLYHLATNQEQQNKLYTEILSVVGKDGEFKESHVPKLRYMKACLIESQRMDKWTGIGPVMRRNQGDIVLSGYNVPKGKWIFLIPYDANIDQRFVPERWVRDSPEYIGDKTSPYSNLPFGYGPRMCIGRRFAQLEIYIVLTKLLQRFKLLYLQPEPIGLSTGIITKPDRKLCVKFVERT